MSEFPRITIRPDQMGGVPCIRGVRMPVATVVRMIANGLSVAQILDLHPTLEADDVREALQYAAKLAERPVMGRPERALVILERAQRNATLDDDEAMSLAVNEVRAYRAARATRQRS